MDQFIKEMLKEDGLKSPSEGFVNKVMGSIDMEVVKESRAYRPLLNSRVWAVLSSAIVLVLIFSWQGSNTGTSGLYTTWNKLNLADLFSVGEMNTSVLILYGLASFGLLLVANSFLMGKQLTEQ